MRIYIVNTSPGTSDSDLILCTWVAGTTTCTDAGVVTRYAWSHVRFNLALSDAITVYVNGHQAANNTLPTGLASGIHEAGASLYLGADNTTSFSTAFDGQVDEFRVWLTPDSASLNGTRFETVSPYTSGLKMYLNFDYTMINNVTGAALRTYLLGGATLGSGVDLRCTTTTCLNGGWCKYDGDDEYVIHSLSCLLYIDD